MLRKILLTLLVIAAVVIFYRIKNQMKKGKQEDNPSEVKGKQAEADNKLNPMIMAYGIVGFIIVFSSLVWALNLFDNNEIINVRVINANQQVTTYQVRRKDFKDRKFITVENRHVQLSDNDRIEVIKE